MTRATRSSRSRDKHRPLAEDFRLQPSNAQQDKGAVGRQDGPADEGQKKDQAMPQEQSMPTVDEDDFCPICQQVLYQPVVTRCNHVLCRSCMARWADVSITSQMVIVSPDEQPADFDAVSQLEARCPMCRTQTSATVDQRLCEFLEQKYPKAYSERRVEEDQNERHGQGIQTLTVYIGNCHELVTPRDGSANAHEWTFFVKPSRTEIVEEVQIFLHPTFRPNRLIRSRPPYEIRRLGWGYFTIIACVILKAGYSWVSDDAEDSPDGAAKGMLRLEWELDFSGHGGIGSMARCKLKVKNDRNWEDIDEEEQQDAAEWNRMVRQYERDGRYEPDEE